MIYQTFPDAQRVFQFEPGWGARKLSLKLAPLQAIACALDLIAAVGGVISLIATGGVEPEITAFTCRRYAIGIKVFAFPFVDLLRAVNPQARFLFEPQQEDVLDEEEKLSSQLPANWIFMKLDPLIEEYKKGDRLIAARILYVALMAAVVFIRCVEFLISCAAVPISLISRGKWETVNSIAFWTLQAAPNAFFDIAGCFIKLINLQATRLATTEK